MEHSVKSLQLNISGVGSQQTVTLRQGDTACTLVARFWDGERARYPLGEDCRVYFRGVLPSKEKVVALCQNSKEEASYTLSPNTTALPGEAECEFAIVGEGGKQLATPKFTLLVQPTAVTDLDITQTAEFSAFTGEIDRMKQVEAACLAAAKQGEKGEKGDPGYTPQREIDYWTDADKQEILDEIKGQKTLSLTQNGYMEGGDGWASLNSSVSTAKHSGFVKIPDGFTHLEANLSINQYGWAVLFATGNGTGLLTNPQVSVLGKRQDNIYHYLVAIPSDANYVCVSTYNRSDADYACFVTQKEETAAPKASPLEGVEFALFRQFGVVGDSLSVGHTANSSGDASSPHYDYSWGQFLARSLGNTCLHFGRSGLTAKDFMTDSKGYGELVREENLCQAYLLALGANDTGMPLGSLEDIDFSNMENNGDTEYGHYAKVIDAIRTTAPSAPIFLFTLPYPRNTDPAVQAINGMIRTLAVNENFTNLFLVDLDTYYDEYFREGKIKQAIGNTGWHFTPLGYLYCSVIICLAVSAVMAVHAPAFQDVFLLPYGTKAATQTTEEWVFRLEDGSTLTKRVVVEE